MVSHGISSLDVSKSKPAPTKPVVFHDPLPINLAQQLRFSQTKGVLNDDEIRYFALTMRMITPFYPQQVREDDVTGEKVISYGLSSSGYDIRLGFEFQVPINRPDTHLHYIDPKQHELDANYYTTTLRDPFFLPPHGYIRGNSLEAFHMPRFLQGVAMNKSTYARSAVVSLVTPLEPGWRGILTLEIANITNLPVKLYPGEGIVQIVFHTLNPCMISYGDRKGKYQDQVGVQAPLV